jgi:hypothetical protein
MKSFWLRPLIECVENVSLTRLQPTSMSG